MLSEFSFTWPMSVRRLVTIRERAFPRASSVPRGVTFVVRSPLETASAAETISERYPVISVNARARSPISSFDFTSTFTFTSPREIESAAAAALPAAPAMLRASQ